MKIQPKQRVLNRSMELLEKAKGIIPACTQTFSKGPSQFVYGVAPIYLEKGYGSHVWDVDGNEYIDLCMGLWPITLGYCYPKIVEAVRDQAEKGQTFSLMHPLEIEVSEKLIELNPWAEMVRFAKNGSDVTTAAIKVSRAYTGRDMIARCSTSYHGWHDWYICSTERNRGVPAFNKELCKIFDYNDIDGFRGLMDEYGDQIACVIMEGVVVNPPNSLFLSEVERITHKHGALLIFDEVINGFRLAIGGASEFFNISVDLACFGKGMANGFPVSALIGKKDVMKLFEESVFFSFTFGGETIGLAACKAAMDIIVADQVIEYVWNIGKRLNDGMREMIDHFDLEDIIVPKGYPVRTILQFMSPGDKSVIDLGIKSLFQQEVLKRGVLLAEYHALSYSHSAEDIDHILNTYGDAMRIVRDAINTNSVDKRLEGRPVEPVLRRPD